MPTLVSVTCQCHMSASLVTVKSTVLTSSIHLSYSAVSGGGRDADSSQEGRGLPWCGGKRQPCSVAPS